MASSFFYSLAQMQQYHGAKLQAMKKIPL